MLVPFVIDVSSLAPDQSWTQPTQRACYNGLLDVWRRVGLLAHDGDVLAKSRLCQAVNALPQFVRPRWQEILVQLPSLPTPAWSGTVNSGSLSEFSAVAQLALVDDTCAEVEFGYTEDCDEGRQSVNGSELSICRLIAASQARAFQEALELSATHISIGDSYEKTWTTRFSTLAKAPIKLISIVDRYAIGQHMNCPQSKLSGLARFLKLLDSDASGDRHVTIYSAWTRELSGPPRQTIDDIEGDLRSVFERLQRKNVKRIKVVMVPNSAFRDEAHDRFVRFGGYVWDIGLGLKVFEGPRADEKTSASFKSGIAVTGYKDIERELAGNSEMQVREIR